MSTSTGKAKRKCKKLCIGGQAQVGDSKEAENIESILSIHRSSKIIQKTKILNNGLSVDRRSSIQLSIYTQQCIEREMK